MSSSFFFLLSGHPLFSQGVESLLRRETGLEVVGREADVDKAIRRIKELRPDVVITMCIYRGEQRVVEEVKDLVEAIEPSPLSPEPVSSEDLPGHGAQLTI